MKRVLEFVKFVKSLVEENRTGVLEGFTPTGAPLPQRARPPSRPLLYYVPHRIRFATFHPLMAISRPLARSSFARSKSKSKNKSNRKQQQQQQQQ